MANKPIKSIKYPGLSDTYTFAQIDTTLSQSGKAADAQAVGNKFTEVSATAGKAFPTDTLSGDIVTFADGANNIPMKSVVVNIEPAQDLHGQESPYPAGGGKNKFDGYTANWKKWQLNNNVFTTRQDTDAGVTFTPNEDGTVTVVTTGTYMGIAVEIESSDADRVFSVSGATYVALYSAYEDGASRLNVSPTYATISAGVSGCIGIRFDAVGTYTIKCQLESGSTATDYAPYSNICPISGWTGAQVVRAGKNLFDAQTFADEHGLTFSGDTLSGETSPSVLNWVLWENTSAYTGQIVISGLFSAETISNHTLAIIIVYTDGTRDRWYPWDGRTNKVSDPNKTVATVGPTYGSVGTWSVSKLQIELGSTATDYEPYTGDTYSITFPSEAGTVYGGTLDVTNGVLTVDRAMVDLGTLTWVYTTTDTVAPIPYFAAYSFASRREGSTNLVCSQYARASGGRNTLVDKSCSTFNSNNSKTICIADSSYTDATAFKTAMNGVQLVYELATPITYTLTPTEIKSLLGDNNVWADAGDTAVTYRADTAKYIDKKIAEVINALS